MIFICSCGRSNRVRPGIVACKCGRKLKIQASSPARKRKSRKPVFALRSFWKEIRGMVYGSGFVILGMIIAWVMSSR